MKHLTTALFVVGAMAMSISSSAADDKKPVEKKKVDLIMTRTFDAPVEQVWNAWTKSEYVMRWWGPTGFTCPVAKMDVREGKTSLVCMRAPKDFGGQDMYSTWEYRKVEPMKRLEFIHNLSDKDGKKADPTKMGLPADFPIDQRQVVTFKSVGTNKTEMTVIEYDWTECPLLELSKKGLGECLDKMAASFVKKD